MCGGMDFFLLSCLECLWFSKTEGWYFYISAFTLPLYYLYQGRLLNVCGISSVSRPRPSPSVRI